MEKEDDIFREALKKINFMHCMPIDWDELSKYSWLSQETYSHYNQNKKDMENKLEISIPEGMEIDEEKSVLKEGKIVFKKKEEKENTINTWNDLSQSGKCLNGFYIDTNSFIQKATNNAFVCCNINTFLTKEQVKSALAMAQISQLMPYYGGAITNEEWNTSSDKYIIERINNDIYSNISYTKYFYFLAFHTEEQRDRFMKYNEQLIKDYLMID